MRKSVFGYYSKWPVQLEKLTRVLKLWIMASLDITPYTKQPKNTDVGQTVRIFSNQT